MSKNFQPAEGPAPKRHIPPANHAELAERVEYYLNAVMDDDHWQHIAFLTFDHIAASEGNTNENDVHFLRNLGHFFDDLKACFVPNES